MRLDKRLMIMIKGISRNLSVLKKLVSYPVLLVLLSSITFQGCLTRTKVEATIWLETGLPVDLCDKYPEIADYGHYRKLNNGKYEFISYCKKESRDFINIVKQEFYKFLDELLPKDNN